MTKSKTSTSVATKSETKGLSVKTRIRAGGITLNHVELSLPKVAAAAPVAAKAGKNLNVKTRIRAGGISVNHVELALRRRGVASR